MKNPYLRYGLLWLILISLFFGASFFLKSQISFDLPWYLWLLAAANLSAFILFAVDKAVAGTGATRAPEVILYLACLLGGSIGGYAGMEIFRHKTRKPGFKLVIALIGLFQIGLCVYFFAKTAAAPLDFSSSL